MDRKNRGISIVIDAHAGFVRRYVDCDWAVHFLTIRPTYPKYGHEKLFSAFSCLAELLRWADIPFCLNWSRYQCIGYLPCHPEIFSSLNELIAYESSFKIVGMRIAPDFVEEFTEMDDTGVTGQKLGLLRNLTREIELRLKAYRRTPIADDELNQILEQIHQFGLDKLDPVVRKRLDYHSRGLSGGH